LIANLLNAHEHVTIYRDYLHLSKLQQRMGNPKLDTRMSDAQKRVLLQFFLNEDNAKLGVELNLDPAEFSNLREFYVCALSRIALFGDVVVGHKTTGAYAVLGELLNLVPDLKIIYVVRDPRDVIASSLKRFEEESKETVYDFVWDWRKSRSAVRFHMESKGCSDEVFLLRYEDLLLSTEETLARLATFLDVEKLEVPESLTDYGTPWKGNSSFDSLSRTLDPAPIGRWKAENPNAGKIVEVLLKKEMIHDGYVPEFENATLFFRFRVRIGMLGSQIRFVCLQPAMKLKRRIQRQRRRKRVALSKGRT